MTLVTIAIWAKIFMKIQPFVEKSSYIFKFVAIESLGLLTFGVILLGIWDLKNHEAYIPGEENENSFSADSISISNGNSGP